MMIFEQLNPGDCKTYLIASNTTKEAILVDPLLGRVGDYLQLLAARGLRLTHLIDTHVHADHLSGAAALREKTGAAYLMHKNSVAKCVTQRVQDGESLQLGDIKIQFLHTPGHTKDSLTLIVGDRMLTGDFLFLGDSGAGRTDLPGGDSGDHYDAIQKLKNLPDSMIVYPGHDYHGREKSTLGEERKRNDRFAARTKSEYVQWLSGFKLGPSDWMVKVVQANYLCTQDPNAVEIPCEAGTCEVKNPAMATAAGAGAGAVPREISCEELSELLQKKRPDLVLDVRNPDEFTGELGHIAGARLLPLPELGARAIELMEYQNKSVVTICKLGGRSSKAAAALLGLGFRDVKTMAGGMVRWKSLGLPSEK